MLLAVLIVGVIVATVVLAVWVEPAHYPPTPDRHPTILI
jgi:hypothetical protein